ncbi:hypothetical protein GC207_12730 [bacterium]|nr:hypothetical protein [bacterium]
MLLAKVIPTWLMFVAGIVSFASLSNAASTGLQPGDPVTSFSTVLRRYWWNNDLQQTMPTGTTLTLDDFAGKILFIEFFDPYCSICREGISQTATKIKDYYKAQNGNAHGVPVVYMAINLEPADWAQYEADYLLDQYTVSLRCNDYTDSQTDVAVNLFASHTSKPVFVAINCVPNSPNYRYREVLVNSSGLVESQVAGLVDNWKAIIDSVEAPPPSLKNEKLQTGGAFEFTFYGQTNTTYLIQSSTNFLDWTTADQFSGTNGPILFRKSNILPERGRFFRVIQN